MVSFKMLLVLAGLLLTVSANPVIETSTRSIPLIDGADFDFDLKDYGIDVTDLDNISFLDRASSEKAVFAVKKVETGYARTTNVGLTVQKGTSGIIKFHIRVKAVTAEALALKAKLFVRKLTKAQKKQLFKLSKRYEGDLEVPWLKLLGIDLSKTSTKKDFLKARSKTRRYDKLALLAKALLKDVVAQNIEVKGVLKAKGISFIPTTVFSFIKIAKVYFEDGSTTLVVSDHPGDVEAATKDGGKVVPAKVKSLKVL